MCSSRGMIFDQNVGHNSTPFQSIWVTRSIYIYMFMYMILYMIPSTTLMVSSMYTINSTMDIAGVVAYGYMKLNNHNIRYMMVHGPT